MRACTRTGPLMRAVTVIVPTLALAARGTLLRRALASLAGQDGVRVLPLVVVNGTGADAALVRELRADPRLRVVTRSEASHPGALLAGRELVDTPYFAELDDDDVVLPGALLTRVRALEADPDACAVVTNGYRRSASGDVLHVPDPGRIDRDPLGALREGNWLLPGSWLCRTDRVGTWLFEGMPSYLECTWVAVRLAVAGPIRFLAEPTVAWHLDTPQAMSRSPEYVLGQDEALRKLLRLEMPDELRAAFRGRLRMVCHVAAEHCLREGSLREAWRWHLRSLCQPGGLRHLTFTRRLLFPRGLQ